MTTNYFLKYLSGGIGLACVLASVSACSGRSELPSDPNPQGSGGGGGAGGAGDPSDPVEAIVADKVDLLFMIDNSISMADKQAALAKTVTDLVQRLVNPACVKSVGNREEIVVANPTGPCPEGTRREFEPVEDIHIGIISSSLGGNGADMCGEEMAKFYPTANDKAHLLSRGSDGSQIPTYEGKGFLQWDPASRQNPAGESSQQALTDAFEEMILGVGQTGCGYEQSLEAVYRFLVDPEPYKKITLKEVGKNWPIAELEEVDETLLQQRREFLRPDSLVAIVSLTDENDCSTLAGNFYYQSLHSDYKPPRANSACAEDPNSECCGPCLGWNAPAHCTPNEEDAECKKNDGRIDRDDDNPNLRCFDQKRRFGVEWLYPIERYVAGVQQRLVPNRQGEMVRNPLYSDLRCGGVDCQPARDPSLIVWAMIVGVPWQDLAKDPKDLSKGYMNSSELVENDRWSVIVGNPKASPPVFPKDPHMIESIAVRGGAHPITNEPLVPPSEAAPPAFDADPINGHERLIPTKDDLQYACTFRLPEPHPSSPGDGCAFAGDQNAQDPLCQNPQTNAFETTQYAGKAYPGIRHLQVAQGLGEQSVVASICPANLNSPEAEDFGYRPAIGALMGRLKQSLRSR